MPHRAHNGASDDGESGVPTAGYPAHAAWIALDSDSEGFMYRKFGQLSARNLLFIQSQLNALDEKLKNYDREMELSRDQSQKMSQSCWELFEEKLKIHGRPEKKVKQLQSRIRRKLREYHEALLFQSQVAALGRPDTRMLSALRSWTAGEGYGENGEDVPIIGGRDENTYEDEDDLVALRAPTKKDVLSNILRNNWRHFRKPKRSFAGFAYYSDHVIVRTVAVISTIVAAVLLVGAIATLYFVTKPGARLGIIAGFTVLFASSVALLTNAKRAEIFAATAAYAAVLVVFVSGDLGGSTSRNSISQG